MSNLSNDEIYDRARNQMEYHTGTWLERAIQYALDHDDLETLYQLIIGGEAQEALERDAELLGERDVF